MCKFNLSEAINASIDPLQGWDAGLPLQKLPPPNWDYQMVAPSFLEDVLPSMPAPAAGQEGLIPDDLQDLFLDSSSVCVPELPSCEANCMLDDLLSGPSSPEDMFGALSPLPEREEAGACGGGELQDMLPPPEPLLTPQLCDFRLPSPDTMIQQQVCLDGWVPTMSPPLPEPGSPPVVMDVHGGLPTGPDWTPPTLAPPTKRRQARPKPYDKQARRQITEEERRQRKKEQNKTAATRYRRKKKEEQETIFTDQETLEARNADLKERVGSLTRELGYLKHLMQEVMKYKRGM